MIRQIKNFQGMNVTDKSNEGIVMKVTKEAKESTETR
jgi:hypothetical protein